MARILSNFEGWGPTVELLIYKKSVIWRETENETESCFKILDFYID